MTKTLHKNSQGIAHLGLILVAVVVIAGIGFAAWRMMGAKETPASKAAETVAETIAEAKCDYDDKDLCKFFASYKAHDSYKIDGVNIDAEGAKSTSVYETQGKDKSHMVTSGGGYDMNIITIGKVTYTKAGDNWWKKTQPDDKPNEYTEDYESDLEEPSKDEPEAAKTVYKLIGKEACGSLECFKYQVVDPEANGQEQFIWFDTKDYQMRRQTTKDADGSSTDMSFSYTGVTISEPSPVKELGANQYIVPGQAEPMTIPTM